MSTFTDANGTEWDIVIKVKHVEEIKRYCKGRDGKPIDLLAILERANLEALLGDTETMVNAVFTICYGQIREHFNLADYDEANKDEYEAFPDLKTESARFKAARWFAERVDGPALKAMFEAFQEALVNFCPSEGRQTALKKILEKTRELERVQTEDVLREIDEAMPKVQAEMRKQMQESLSDALSGSMPASAG